MDDEQGYTEIIMPTVNGCLNILKSAERQGVKNVVICSSTSSTNPVPPVPIKNEIDQLSHLSTVFKLTKMCTDMCTCAQPRYFHLYHLNYLIIPGIVQGGISLV